MEYIRKMSFDEALETLSNVHRRRILLKLLDHNPRDERMEVTEEIADEVDVSVEKLEAVMFHVHLPKLETSEFINWERETGEVTKGARFDEIRPLLSLMVDHADELPDDYI